MGQDDLFQTLVAKLSHSNLIRNISPMWKNMEVQLTSNYFLGVALQIYIKISHVDLIGDLAVRV